MSISAYLDTDSEDDDEMYEGSGIRLFELEGLQSALRSVSCKECGDGPVIVKEDFTKQNGLCTKPRVCNAHSSSVDGVFHE